MWWMFAAALAATSVEADFDGDGKKDKIVATEDVVKLNGLEPVDCAGGCSVEVVDIAADKPGKELVLCTSGPRDDVSCDLYRQAKGTWSYIGFPAGYGGPSAIVTKGNGFVLAYTDDRWVSRVEKYSYDGATLTRFVQPFYSTVSERRPDGFTIAVDRSFALVTETRGSVVVANVAPKTTAVALLEAVAGPEVWDPDERWFLVRLSSGLVGWASLASIIQSSDELIALNSAG